MGFGKNKSNSGVSKTTSRQQQEVYNTARNAGNAPIPGAIGNAQGFYGGATQAGQQGIDALSGNAAAQQQFMNPYQQQVIDQLNNQFANQNQMTSNMIGDQATQARAFGGSRHAVAEGVALGENQRNQASLLANTYQQGFDNSMNRAGQVAGLGFNAAGAGAGLGMQAGNQDIWRLNMLNQGYHPIQTANSSGFNVSR